MVMRNLLLGGIVIFALFAAEAPVSGQTLAERIEAVRQKRAEQEAGRSKGPSKVQMLQVLFYKTLSVDFQETPARDVFDYLRTALGVNVIVRYADDPVGHGIDPQKPITLQVKDMVAVEVLDLVLEQCSTEEPCTWQIRRSFIEIGTKERLSARDALELRIYPIDDLLFEAPKFTDSPPIGIVVEDLGYSGDGYGGSIQVAPAGGNTGEEMEQRARSLIDVITETIEPEAWTVNGGTWASIEFTSGVAAGAGAGLHPAPAWRLSEDSSAARDSSVRARAVGRCSGALTRDQITAS